MSLCPRCHTRELDPEKALNSLSRRDNKTYICQSCGREEAFIDTGELEPDDIELEFVRTHKRPKGGK